MAFEFTIKTGEKRGPKRMRVNLRHVQQCSVSEGRRRGYSISHLSRVFSGKTKPSITCAEVISNALNITLDEFLDRLKRRRFHVGQ